MTAPVKVYVWCDIILPGGDQGWYAVAEDGEVIATHICSSEHWARHDLHDVKLGDYLAKFGIGAREGTDYELVWEEAPDEVAERNHARFRVAEGGAS